MHPTWPESGIRTVSPSGPGRRTSGTVPSRGRPVGAFLATVGVALLPWLLPAQPEPLCGQLVQASAPKSLAGKLDPLAPPSELPAGVVVDLVHRPSGDLGAVWVEPAVRNTGPTEVALAGLPVLSLSFRLRPRPEDAAFAPLAYRDDEWYGSAYWSGPGWTRVGKDWHHPGDGIPSVRRFVVPRDGQIRIGGHVRKLHLAGDGIEARILHGRKTVWQATIAGDDATGVEPDLGLEVKAGDRIRFVVHQRGTIVCDTTGWDPVVTYADGESFQASAAFGAAQGRGGWSYEMQRSPPEAAGFLPLTYSTGTWYGSTFWTGPDWTRVGKDWHHPGENTPSVRRFAAPRDGQIRIAGAVRKLHLQGDGIRAAILHGDQPLWETMLEGADADGQEPDLTVAVRKGDSLRFVVHKRGSIACDTTYWDPTVTYADGEAFQASAAFGSGQGGGNWFYELLADDLPSATPPAVASFARDLVPSLRRLATDSSLAVASEAALPLLLVVDADDASGLGMAVNARDGWTMELSMPDRDTCRATLRWDLGSLPAGETRRLPAVLLQPYEGCWTIGQAMLAHAAAAGRDGDLSMLWGQLAESVAAATGHLARPPEPDLLLMALAEWCREDRLDGTAEAYARAAEEQTERARALLDTTDSGHREIFARAFAALAREASAAPAAGLRYLRARLLKRDLLLADPLLGDTPIVFCKRRPPNYSHLVMQYYGWRQRPGGGLFVLEAPGRSLRAREITPAALPRGSFLEPKLSYDARRLVFAYVTVPDTPIAPASLSVNEEGPEEAYFHLYTMGVDGSDLRQLTAGTYDDTMPVWLPDGGIAFCSTRRRGYSRCFGGGFSHRWDSYTLHRIEADGGGLRQLSWNDVSEWFPEVSNTGHLLFARWDYIDRDAVTHQNLWAMRPDGTNQLAVWGNATPNPHCTFQAKAIPGSSRIVFVASAHHSVTGGPLCLLDPTVDYNSSPEAITRLTPQPFPESEGRRIPDYYDSPWPLSESLFLVAYSPEPLRFEPAAQPDNALGVYLIDAAGNRELLCRDPHIGCTSPTPLRSRPTPPQLASALPPAEEGDALAEVFLTDVYQGLGEVPRGTIRELRIIQIFPKTTPYANIPPIGFAGEENTRAVLGTVPVDPDGSARFLVPSRRPLLFQALDANGDAFQTMRSTTVFQPGETTSCIGCHENRMAAPPRIRPSAHARPPERLRTGPADGVPVSYMTLVQPIWNRNCLACHGDGPQKPPKGIRLTATPRQGFAESYWSLCGDPKIFWGKATNPENAAQALVPRFGARNRVERTPPGGIYGARGSRLLKMLRKGHGEVRLDADELRRIALWIDCNAVFYGSYHPEIQTAELAGNAPPMPAIQ